MLSLLCGCSLENPELHQAMDLRSRLLQAEGCSFDALITADYGDSVQNFTVSCQADGQGSLRFTVTKPETIEGISGTLSQQGGQLTFDDKVLAFPYLTDDQLSPVSAPWVFLSTLRSGYLTAAGKEGEQIRILAKDSYQERALHVDIWLEPGAVPCRSEILYNGRRILTLEIQNFRLKASHE